MIKMKKNRSKNKISNNGRNKTWNEKSWQKEECGQVFNLVWRLIITDFMENFNRLSMPTKYLTMIYRLVKIRIFENYNGLKIVNLKTEDINEKRNIFTTQHKARRGKENGIQHITK